MAPEPKERDATTQGSAARTQGDDGDERVGMMRCRADGRIEEISREIGEGPRKEEQDQREG